VASDNKCRNPEVVAAWKAKRLSEGRPYYWGSCLTLEEYNARARLRYHAHTPEKRIEFNRRRHNRFIQLRRSVLEKLGGKCVRCGFDDERALQIDHINGGGAREFEKLGHGEVYYRYLLDLPKIEKTYQLLCANCNWIKRVENGEERGYLQ